MKPILAIISLAFGGFVLADDNEESSALEAERQRLGNARIQYEMERRAREQEQRLEAEQQDVAQATEAAREQEEQGSPDIQDAATDQPDDHSIAETLELLQKLGDLKDAGYVTEDEFARLKEKILSDHL